MLPNTSSISKYNAHHARFGQKQAQKTYCKTSHRTSMENQSIADQRRYDSKVVHRLCQRFFSGSSLDLSQKPFWRHWVCNISDDLHTPNQSKSSLLLWQSIIIEHHHHHIFVWQTV